jgi:predicted RNA-binding Zn-ribbon protein involved in translation (DUF1610 family)
MLMPITPFLAHQAFEPEIIKTMSAAFVQACDTMHLKIGDDPAARVVAEKVIELAQRGVRDPDMLRTITLKELSKSEPIPFSCPLCEAEYKIVTIDTCDAQYGKISCLKCGFPFPAGEGNVMFKYFLVRRPRGRKTEMSHAPELRQASEGKGG